MTVKIVQRDDLGVVVVELIGELDLDSAPMLRAVLSDLLDRGRFRIVVDAGELRFCDSVGLSALLLSHRACAAQGGFLRLARVGELLANLLGMVGLSEVLTCYDSVAGAAAGDPGRRSVLPVRHRLH
ncbi:STAS domain-containing protein [Catellatospora sp. KI3]|uniref:STAS domain-containing protein n=1 Tax=Catellatospora sp. KI3 TaxID=3041620 RepID=UPI00248255AA|nr:STAS domain-containing protein [Catellatospora sp. KI3]MDI1462122.1 STAS domain-containing protein [Catellatospora sp. KI3]